MALRCVSPYKGSFRYKGIVLEPGQVVDDPELEAHLLKDSPASFELVDLAPEVKVVESAPVDKMVKGPQVKKGARHGK